MVNDLIVGVTIIAITIVAKKNVKGELWLLEDFFFGIELTLVSFPRVIIALINAGTRFSIVKLLPWYSDIVEYLGYLAFLAMVFYTQMLIFDDIKDVRISQKSKRFIIWTGNIVSIVLYIVFALVIN
ncbi:hypothetical protein [Mucilaginibacter ginsenosidivorax]|uniref:Uncharacterized protein n=1 Tax=Mucilaginibacter ginsenosidivorax TaxID=862126 RepID=A0A5B8W774_9SPHI|nr:hypothetical protein [Mucilaginibacter ginsenosidivorax]QEC79327.1 hypothetical protein FSB76_26510 [Mucilaginibacter ginsenosidivorax]